MRHFNLDFWLAHKEQELKALMGRGASQEELRALVYIAEGGLSVIYDLKRVLLTFQDAKLSDSIERSNELVEGGNR